MSSARSNRVVGLWRALGFGVTAWRDLWVVLFLSAIGPGVMFFGEHGPVSRDFSMMLMLGGFGWSMLMAAPTLGGLYRGALSQFVEPRGRRFNLGLAGLQWGLAEWRLIGLGILMFLLAVLFLAPAGVVAGGVAYALRTQTDFSMLTSLRYGAFAGLAVMALYPLVALRIALGGAATVAEDRISLFQTWPLTHRRMGAVAAALLLVVSLYPVALLATAAVNSWETGAFDLSMARWPLIDAAVGAVASGLLHGALMPALFTGVLTSLYLNWRPQQATDELKKPTLRVTADMVDSAAADDADDADAAADAHAAMADGEPGRDGVVIPFSRPFRRDDKLAASLELVGPDEDLQPAASAFQIGADRISWPGDPTEHNASGATRAPIDVPMPDLSRVLAVWPELGLAALQFGKGTEAPAIVERHDAATTEGGADPSGHGHSGLEHSGLEHPSLEHPMLLSSCDEPEKSEAEPASDETDALGDTYFWWDVDPRRMPDLFQAGSEATSVSQTSAIPAPPAPDRVEEGEEPQLLSLPTPVAVAPGVMAAPPPTQVVAFVAPRPFDGAARHMADAAAANDPPGAPERTGPKLVEPAGPTPSVTAPEQRDLETADPVDP